MTTTMNDPSEEIQNLFKKCENITDINAIKPVLKEIIEFVDKTFTSQKNQIKNLELQNQQLLVQNKEIMDQLNSLNPLTASLNSIPSQITQSSNDQNKRKRLQSKSFYDKKESTVSKQKPLSDDSSKMKETNEISMDFDKLEFGVNNKSAAYEGTRTVASLISQSSSVPSLICLALKNCCVKFIDGDYFPLPNHIIGYNDCDQKVFVRAEVRFDNLDKGEDLTAKSLIEYKVFAFPGDIPYPFFPKNIGGIDLNPNVFPLNPEADISLLKAAISTLYNHVKEGKENSARLIYIIDNQDLGRERPTQLFFNFKLYKSGEIFGEHIDGKITNLRPPRTYI